MLDELAHGSAADKLKRLIPSGADQGGVVRLPIDNRVRPSPLTLDSLSEPARVIIHAGQKLAQKNVASVS